MGGAIDKVLPGLYVGGLLGSEGKDRLKEKGVTHVLSIHDNATVDYPGEFVYKCIKVGDIASADLSIYFEECVDYIHECRLGGGSVYVHCAAGMSRSVTIVVMYLMTVSSCNLAESLTIVKYCHREANPNFGFRHQLKKYQEGQLKEKRPRLKEKYPDTDKLEDEKNLKELLVTAKETLGKLWNPFPRDMEAICERDFKPLFD